MAQGAWRNPPNLRQPEGLWGSLGLPGVFGLPWATLGEPQSLWEGLDYPGLRGCLLALWAIGVFPDVSKRIHNSHHFFVVNLVITFYFIWRTRLKCYWSPFSIDELT